MINLKMFLWCSLASKLSDDIFYFHVTCIFENMDREISTVNILLFFLNFQQNGAIKCLRKRSRKNNRNQEMSCGSVKAFKMKLSSHMISWSGQKLRYPKYRHTAGIHIEGKNKLFFSQYALGCCSILL